jgi:AraC-like DNA-binding protein
MRPNRRSARPSIPAVSDFASNLPLIHRRLQKLGPPASLFAGLRVEQSFAPDNIIFFKRTDTAALKPDGVSNNYHHRFELVSVFERPAPLRVDRTSYLLRPGECALIFPNQFHHFMDTEQGKLEWLFITFECRNPEPILELRDSPRTYDDRCIELLAAAVGEFVEPAHGKPDSLRISSLLAELLQRLVTQPRISSDRQDIHSSDDIRDVILEKINRYVREHLERAVSIPDLATELGYSVSHLRAVFRDRLGVSLGRYMRESRLSEAAKLLQSGELSVGGIGDRCGFESLFAFSRAFRKAYGLSPRGYRQLVQQGAPLPQPHKPL